MRRLPLVCAALVFGIFAATATGSGKKATSGEHSASAPPTESTRSTRMSRSTRTRTAPSNTSIRSSSSTTASSISHRSSRGRGSHSKDGKTWTFKTQPHAKWSDGKPLTAADAAWTINTDIKYKGGGAADEAGVISHIKNATAPNATTLVVHYAQAPNSAYVLGQFQQFFILPKHIWAQHLGHHGAGLKTFPNNAPVVGSGPFNLVKFQRNNIAIFERNSSYWGTKPKVQEFGLQQFSNDDAMVTALKAHNLDAIETVPATAMKNLRQAGFTVSDVPGLDETDFIINSNPKKKHHRELLNLKVKEAFDHAIDRKKIASVTFLGAAKLANSIIPATTGVGWHDPHLKTPSFNLKLANQILDKLGYKRGPGGIRVAKGQKMSYNVVRRPTSRASPAPSRSSRPTSRRSGCS